MLKNILIIAVLLVVFNAAFVFLGGLDLLVKTEQAEEEKLVRVDTDIVDVFRFTLEEEVKKKVGQPVEGYEPTMFLQVFPGLAATDFNGVPASIGKYEIVDGQLEHQLGGTDQLIHSAAGAINRRGYEVILNNVAERTDIDLSADGTITDIMGVITSQ